MKKLHFIFFFLFTINMQGFALHLERQNVYFISLAKRTDDNKLWVMYYVFINGKVYSGNYWQGYNANCRLPQKVSDSLYSYHVDENIFLLKKKIDKLQLKNFRTKNLSLNKGFYWNCIKVKMSYVLLDCNIEEKDFLSSMFDRFNGIKPLSIDITSISVSKSLPNDFLTLIEEKIK